VTIISAWPALAGIFDEMNARTTSTSPSWRTSAGRSFVAVRSVKGRRVSGRSFPSSVHDLQIPDGVDVWLLLQKRGERPLGEFHHGCRLPLVEEFVDLFGEHPDALLDLPDVRFDAGHGGASSYADDRWDGQSNFAFGIGWSV